MKNLFIAAAIIFANSASFAQTVDKKEYRPFRYETTCYLENLKTKSYIEDTCVVIETREKGGALRTRNIYSNRFQLTIKSWFDKEKGFMTWDSHNKFEYKWEYKIGSVNGPDAKTYVMPGVLLEQVSWE